MKSKTVKFGEYFKEGTEVLSVDDFISRFGNNCPLGMYVVGVPEHDYIEIHSMDMLLLSRLMSLDDLATKVLLIPISGNTEVIEEPHAVYSSTNIKLDIDFDDKRHNVNISYNDENNMLALLNNIDKSCILCLDINELVSFSEGDFIFSDHETEVAPEYYYKLIDNKTVNVIECYEAQSVAYNVDIINFHGSTDTITNMDGFDYATAPHYVFNANDNYISPFILLEQDDKNIKIFNRQYNDVTDIAIENNPTSFVTSSYGVNVTFGKIDSKYKIIYSISGGVIITDEEENKIKYAICKAISHYKKEVYTDILSNVFDNDDSLDTFVNKLLLYVNDTNKI